MAYSEYWNPKHEIMPREQIEQLQLTKLRRLAEYANERVPFHRRKFAEAGFAPDQLRTLDDLRRIPFMTREAWMESLQETPLFGDLLSTDPINAIPTAPPISRTVSFSDEATPCFSSGRDDVIAAVDGLIASPTPAARTRSPGTTDQ